MNWSFALSEEECHWAKIGDLDALEAIVRKAGDEMEIAAAYERICEALCHRPNTAAETKLHWGQRYLTWARSFTERDGYPVMTTTWAKELFEIAIDAGRRDIAFEIADTIVGSYAPLHPELPWWQKQHYALKQTGKSE